MLLINDCFLLEITAAWFGVASSQRLTK
jgi:hypothetical protein